MRGRFSSYHYTSGKPGRVQQGCPKRGEGATAEGALKRVLHGALQWGTVDKEAVEGSELLGVIEVFFGRVVEDFVEIARGFEAGHREVHHQVIAAVTGTGTWDRSVKLGDEGEGLAHKRQYISTLQVSLDDEVIAGEAAHGSPIDYPFAPLAVVSQECGGKVLYGVNCIRMEHRLPVGLLHPDIKGGHDFRTHAVLSRNENSAFQSQMVNCKTCNLLHMLQKF